MGSGRFDPAAYAAFTSTTAGKPTSGAGGVYASSGMDKDLDPKGVKVRESRDSDDNPQSTPIIVGIDVTGSMGMIADVIARQGLGTLFKDILEQKVVTDPHLMFMAIGDMNCDRAPLQVSQFEADNRIVDQLTKIYLEHGGGGNSYESYNGPWWFAANRTSIDSHIKRGKKGYLFTIGDEGVPHPLTINQIETFLGDKPETQQTLEQELADVQRLYDVFHIIVMEGNHARHYPDATVKGWTDLLGQHAIQLPDHTKLAETIIGIIAMREGAAADQIAARYGKIVKESVMHLPAASTGGRPQLTTSAS